ncbi:MAG: Smr/MutS family protein [Patescibacteria group bacterium]|nr:Smr/MutS family protein [Patescibacteria group bacterium]
MSEQREKPISEYEAASFAAELGSAEEVDLHGMDTESAMHELDKALNHGFMTEVEVIKIIHGRGEQKLRNAVESYLKKCQFVELWRSSNNPA